MKHEFTNTWFEVGENNWKKLFALKKPKKILEIGCYEGRATCFMIETCSEFGDVEIHCVDPWREIDNTNYGGGSMAKVEKRFDYNTSISIQKNVGKTKLIKHKNESVIACSELICQGYRGTYDVVYIDGSHKAPDVLTDAILAFQLLRVGGLMIFDDYAWINDSQKTPNILSNPKIGVDNFVNVHWEKLKTLEYYPLYQLYLEKIKN